MKYFDKTDRFILPLVSVIVPTFNSANYLNACLLSIANQTYSEIELIVVDNNSNDESKRIAEKYTNKVFNYGPERSAQRNYGVSKSNGEYVLIIDSDMELSPEVVSACVRTIVSSSKVKAIVIPEESFGEGFWSQCKKLERSFYVGVKWMEAARFFSFEIFQEMNGYDESNTGTEDYDLPQRIEAKYGSEIIGRVDELIFHNEQKINIIRSCKKKFYYAQNLQKYSSEIANKGNYKRQSNLFARYVLFLSCPDKLLQKPVLGLGMLFMKTAEFAAGGVGHLFDKVKNAFIK